MQPQGQAGDKEQESRPGRRKRPYSKLCRLNENKHGDSRPKYVAHEITAIHRPLSILLLSFFSQKLRLATQAGMSRPPKSSAY